MNVQERIRELKKQEKRASKAVSLSAAALALLFAWASLAKIDQIVIADGEILPPSQTQTIQNLEGGIIRELKVAEGDHVKQGQVLGRLHSEAYESELNEIGYRIASLEVRKHRLEAEALNEAVLQVPEALAQDYPSLINSEQSLLRATLKKREADLQFATEAVQVSAQRAELLAPLVKKKLVPEIDLLSANDALLDARRQVEEIEQSFELARSEDYAKTLQELASLQQVSRAVADKLKRAELISPVDGLVNKISATTIGGVVGPGEEILEIIPHNEGYIVEAKIKPVDVALVSIGQKANVRIPALENETRSQFSGQVVYIAAYTDTQETIYSSDTFYKVKIEVSEFNNPAIAIETVRPGMIVNASLVADRTSILLYLLQPIFSSLERSTAI